MGKGYSLCDKKDCFANINYGLGNMCKALDIVYEKKCPFYKSDPDGFIAKRIERDIKHYSTKYEVKNER